MPLSTVCVSTVSSRPRAWSSYTNIRAKDVQGITSMNSTDEIRKYKETIDNYYSPTLSKRLLGYGYDFPEKSPKKDKKWSLGSFFRRKKKDESETSSEEESRKKGFLNRKKRKSENSKKKKAQKSVGTFDHVVISRNSHLYTNAVNGHEENAVLSDPCSGFNSRSVGVVPQAREDNVNKESVDEVDNCHINVRASSVDNVNKKSKKGLRKVRAEARRDNLKHDTSSDEDSQRSMSSSRFRSDESLGGGHGDLMLNRRSRAARTERYLKRHSKDGENPNNYLRLSKSDVENSAFYWKTSDDSNRSLSRSPLVPNGRVKLKSSLSSLSQAPSISGLSTIPPSHGSLNKIRVSNSTSNASYKPPLSMNEYNYRTRRTLPEYENQRSWSYDANIHKAPSTEIQPEVIHVQFPLGKPNNRFRNLSLIDSRLVNSARQPPPPPPRDPKRLVTAQYYDNARPSTFYFDNAWQNRSKSFNKNSMQPPPTMNKFNSFNLHSNCRSTSEDHLPKTNVQLLPRPSSATPEATRSQKYNDLKSNPENFNYLTDKKPRSRRPIFIKSANSEEQDVKSGTQKVLDFWKQKDKQDSTRCQDRNMKKPDSPQMFTCQTHVQTQVFLPSVLANDIHLDKLKNSTDSLIANENEDVKEELKSKSTNLEEALDELEAIYNSLRLGDDDLLERAEQREKDAAVEKLRLKQESYPSNISSRGALSDSSFSYEPFDAVDMPRRKRFMRKSQTIDRRTDDMAYRKMQRDRSSTINDPQSMISKLSYLEASPVYGKEPANEVEVLERNPREPDVTLDDVVYRNVKFSNSVPKVVETQPPFGIPLGPVTAAANSDYLHVVPDKNQRPCFQPRKIPDLVKDDLAFRNLRKDHGKEPALPPLSSDDFKNNNSEPKLDLNSLKKKRAVRSLSANIGSLINKDLLTKRIEKDKYNNNCENENKTLTDIADAMEIARQVLREKENKISATRRAFLSDTDTNNGNMDSVAESRMNFLNSLKTMPQENYLHVKPPRGVTPDRKSSRSPKESTPIPISPLEDKLVRSGGSHDSSLDELLTSLATEARETNERITKELQAFAEENCDNLHRTLSDIDAVSEQAKLCEKLLEGVVDSNDLMTSTKPVLEIVEQIQTEPVLQESVANVVIVSKENSLKNEKENRVKISCGSDHDYENLISDEELHLHDIIVGDAEMKCTSPFEEHKAELIASFQELKKNVELDNISGELNSIQLNENENDSIKNSMKKEDYADDTVTGKRSPRHSHSRLPRWLRPYSCENSSNPRVTMSEGQDNRAERIARYKEQRRKELAAQFSVHCDSNEITPRRLLLNKDSNSSSSEGGPRTTRASRLRAAAAQENSSSPSQASKFSSLEKLSASPNCEIGGSGRIERDKSSKRKSNLNRSLNSEEVPSLDADDTKIRRRSRRFFPQEVLDHAKENNDDQIKSDTNILSNSSTSSITASPPSRPVTPRKSELSLHMENARKGITPCSEIGKYKKRPVPLSFRKKTSSDCESSHSEKSTSSNRSTKLKCSSDNEVGARNTRSITRKMEELTALTKETLARVEKLANNRHKNSVKQIKRPLSSSPSKQVEIAKTTNRPSSILKKKIIEQPIIIESVPNTIPVSILKRKVSQDDHKSDNSLTTHTPPVTFSPSVVEPTTTNRKQGILKKRRSLDESQVMRHRSCSPDVANKIDSRSILKNQRRSSMEELTRTQSPELHLHGILKRKTSKNEEDGEHSLNSPQSILKRKSGANSAGSTSSTPHVSITTAVILAAAGGAEMILESETVKPILKKKSFSEEQSYLENSYSDVPKPILKKKSSTDTDDCDERPKKTILKMPRNSLERDNIDFNCKHSIPLESDCDVKPILKQQNGSKEDVLKPRLSFYSEHDSTNQCSPNMRLRNTRRSHTVCSEFNINISEEDSELRRARPLSVSELVMNFEVNSSTGAIPKKSNLKRNSDRYRTQPVTSNELEASLNFVRSPQIDNISKLTKSSPLSSPVGNHSINSILDFTSSLENDSNLNSFFSSLHNTSPDSGVCGKMSSDSAFQSLGDGLELDQEDDKPVEVPMKTNKIESNKLELQMKAIAEEAQKIKLGKINNAGMQKYRNRKSLPSERTSSSRFATQPVTFDEVQEASRLNKTADDSEDKDEADPSNLSLFERIKLFNVKENDSVPQKGDALPRRRLNRFQTQPVTSYEVESARCISPNALENVGQGEDKSNENRRGILKSSTTAGSALCPNRSDPKSVLKKRDSFDGTSDYESRRSILKSEISDVTYDEGISCNDSASDSETATCALSPNKLKIDRNVTRRKQYTTKFGKSSSDTTSDADSSGGREVRNIFRNENKLKVKQALESVLSKSKSHNRFGDDPESTNNKGATVRRSQTQSAMPRAIEELQAKLQQSGESGWKKRLQQNNNPNDELKLLNMNKYNDELSEKSILEIKKDELDAASKSWKNRVEKSDAEKFSVAGRMNKEAGNLSINIPLSKEKKRTPQAKRFKGKEGNDSSSTPVSPDKSRYIELTRSYSVPDPDPDSAASGASTLRGSARKVSVTRPDDFTFTNFYKRVDECKVEHVEVSQDDFDAITRQSLLVQKKNVRVQKRRGASKNPIKALASRDDISNEYTEIITGVAEREKKRLNIENLAKSSSLAHAALAGLVSKEDFSSVVLKKSSFSTTLLPYKDVMLLQVKGRQHVQTRLVEPIADSINEGDNFILITPKIVYNYVGTYANVIEQSRASDIINHIQQSGDLGCKDIEVVTIYARNSSPTKQMQKFWSTLKCDNDFIFTSGGHPEEDGIYETNILATNMIYKLENDELVPWDEYWGAMPKVEMLDATKVIVFDFGAEMYVWSGKNAPLEQKKRAFRLAKDLWDLGYDYTDCTVCPLNVASILGNRPLCDVPKKSRTRPDWALFAKLTQHRETILFKEKFLDWPDFSRIIKVKGDENEKSVDPSYKINACDIGEMFKENSGPDLVIDGQHLGRGESYFDEEMNRLYEFETLSLTIWRISENHPEKLDDESIGHFYNGDSYIIKWNYRTTIKGRELSGKPSRYSQAGRDRCVYFCWQGSNASINEKGYAALLTVELDSEKAPQIRVVEGYESAAFLKLFAGSMIIHNGKRADADDKENNLGKVRLFMVKGEIEGEVFLCEMPCEMRSLRSRTSFVFVDCELSRIILWHGVKSTEQKVRVAKQIVQRIVENKPKEFYFDPDVGDIDIVEMSEGKEEDEFYDILGHNRDEYFSLLHNELQFDFTMRLFYLSSISGDFKATEVLNPHRSEFSSPYPFLQAELYSASQPALFLIDYHHELWLWQGWWPEREDEEVELSDQTGSGAVRWQAERKAAMQTAVNYWQKNHSGDETIPAYLVWAGLEPLEFKNLFPSWEDREDVAELNLKDGRKPNGKLLLQTELALLQRTTYPLSELLQRPLPEGVDPTHLEIYLSSDDFQKLLSVTKEEFQKLPLWKQTAMKKEKGLF